ncbi:MAG: hypothetical protein ACU0A2_11305 [Cognatishimia sp.]|uniref:hypothetical protein n=1 Tax=Cognatishimia sp. TaxID=2211648 RepID=UPI004059A524
MISPLPELYFRLRDGGASVFRMVDDARNGRLDMEQVATINLRSGEIRLGKDKTLSESEQETVDAWLADRRESQPWRRLDRAMQVIEDINQTAHWAQTEASDKDLEGVSDALFLAMHDLRQVLVRRAADRMSEKAKD